MANDLSTIPTDKIAALLEPTKLSPPWLTRSLDALGDGFRPTIPEAYALTADQRAKVEAACFRLDQHLSPAPAAEIGKCVAILQAQYREREVEEVSAAVRAEGYLMALDGVPLFALREAVRRVMQGDGGVNPSFMPKGPELRALVNQISLPARVHLMKMRKLLDAKVEAPPSAEARARVAALMADLSKSLPESRRQKRHNPTVEDHSMPYKFGE